MRLTPRVPLYPAFLVVAAVAATACVGNPPQRRQPTPRASDKAALYGDAALLPTRAGERARNEVALAEEIRAALETLREVEGARVTVATDDRGAPRSAAVVLRARLDTDTNALEVSATRISRAALGAADLPIEVQVSAPSVDEASADAPSNRPPLSLLLLGVLGLGISLGLTFDRAVGMVRRRRAQ
ncbi:MAG: hypothetical protein KUG77_13260 [Nannocystaceae bacterium]|nr:hypothetical protein [Nannocystaceae bacterium]